MKFAKLSLKDRLLAELQEQILTGKIPAGSRVIEQEVATNFNVSRTVVRETMMVLEAQGLIVSTPYKGAEVVRISSTEVGGLLLPLRVQVETFAYVQGLPNFTDELFQKFDQIMDQMSSSVSARDVAGFNQADLLFHGLILEAANSDLVRNIWNVINLPTRIQFAIQTGKTQALLDQFLEDHRKLLAALKTRDLSIALKAIEDHIIETNKPHLGLL